MKKLLFFTTILLLILTVSSGSFAYDNLIRVCLGSGTSFAVTVTEGRYTLNNSSGALATVLAGTTVNIQYNGSSYTVTGTGNTYTGTGTVNLAAANGGSVFTYGGVAYTGDAYATGAYLINYLGMEEYLYGVVGEEIGYNAPLAALEAQAVASRSLAMYWKTTSSKPYDVTNTTSHQVYSGYTARSKAHWGQIRDAVDATAGQVMYYTKDNGKQVLVQSYYCANTGGHSADVQDVWGSSQSDYPYLRGVSAPTDSLPYQSYGTMKFPTGYTWTKVYSWPALQRAVEAAAKKSLGTLKSIVIDRGGNAGNYIESISFVGTSNTATYSKSNARDILGFRSQLYDAITTEQLSVNAPFGNRTTIGNSAFNSTVIRSGQAVVFFGRGYGHGIGMSQWSACVMAGQGSDYRYILNYFYNQNLNNGRLTFEQYKG